MTVRSAENKDTPELITLAKQIIDMHRELDAYYKPSYAYENFDAEVQSWLEDKDTRVLVAEEDGKLIGYIRGVVEDAPTFASVKRIGVVYDTFVAEEFRKKGIGKKLFAELLAWFREQGVKNVELNVDARNPAAIALWRKSGFKDYKLRMRLDL